MNNTTEQLLRPADAVTKVYVLHENPSWMPPYRAALAARGLQLEEWDLSQGHLDLDAEPPEGVFYSRMSASAHTRGNPHAPEYALAVLSWLESHGRRVVNGTRALDLELSKPRQYAALRTLGVRIPATRVAVGADAVRSAVHAMGYPCIVKPSRGGKGLGVLRIDDAAGLEAVLDAGLDAAPDGIVLVQAYIPSADGSVIRNEFVDGRLLYSIRVVTGGGFELCPAEACALPGAAVQPAFDILDGFRHPNHALYEGFLRANAVEIAGIEMIVDPDGVAWTYDVNTNTNYNPDAEAAAGLAGTERSGPGAVAALLARELALVAENRARKRAAA